MCFRCRYAPEIACTDGMSLGVTIPTDRVVIVGLYVAVFSLSMLTLPYTNHRECCFALW